MTKLCVGTDRGLFVFEGEADDWRARVHLLEGAPVTSVARHPTEPDGLYVTTFGQGLHHVNWHTGTVERLGTETLPERVWSVAVSPADPSRLYAGAEPPAIFASRDRGRTWERSPTFDALQRERQWKYHPNPQIGPHVRHVAVAPGNPDRVYAAIQVGGVVRSDDGGSTWHDVLEGIDPDVHTLVPDPADADHVYAVCGGGGSPDAHTFPPDPPLGRPLYESRDGGASWTCISLDLDRTYGVPLALHPRDPAVMVAALARGEPPFWRDRPTHADAVLMVSRDRGRTWSEVRDGLPWPSPRMIEAIAADHRQPGRFFVGRGGPAWRALPPEEQRGDIYTSDDLEQGWRRLPIDDLPPIYNLTVL